ncbi:hypothetical protein PCANC_05646 [Puccinia coronata f. sp. avenae]|uniref:Uncharacterized protein n=1 Tax=Puccinia coronata f. sp. avenae TaxID=200324 RepID=A0A2N5VX09_9BASI|nr:hypothetical protein PCASD_01768 [Puccinia coronata f. sp. avenae]PLW54511.1 hypothetical protein PCANC_05646 [Puccinia coronata f. sp. avenae]
MIHPTKNQIPSNLRHEHQKVLEIWRFMRMLNLNPKKFIVAFLTNNNIDVKVCRGLWGSADGWTSTCKVINVIRGLVGDGRTGKENWNAYILEEAKKKLASNGPVPHKAQESVTWFNANNVGPEFFSKDTRSLRETNLKTIGSPFLYNLIKSKFKNNLDKGNDNED